ncbi:MAG: extracellular solute-binding protein [Acidimicrobiales bacterium]
MTNTQATSTDAGTLRRIKRRSGVPSLSLLGASAVLLAACGPSSTSAATGTKSASGPKGKSAPADIVLWESHNGGPVGAAMSAMVAKFDSTHKSVHVTINVTKASHKLAAAIAAGNPPVLAEISHYDGTFVKANTLVSWNGFIKNSKTMSSSNFLPAVWHNGEVQGQHYRFMADVKLSEIFYNETLFTKAGITSPPSTWAQLAADAAKLKAPGVIPIGWKDSSAHILPAFLSNGGTMLKHGNNVGKAVSFDNAAGRATFSYFHSLYSKGLLVLDHGTTLREDLASGHMAMIDGTSAGYAKVVNAVGGKFKVGAFVEPAGSTGHAANLAQGLGFVLPRGHTHAQDQAAYTFVHWWFQSPQQAQWAQLGTGYPPETKGGLAAVSSSYVNSHPGLQQSIVALKSPYTYPRPVSDSYREVQTALDTEFLDITEGKVSVSAGLATLDKQGNSYMSGASAL